jgi:carbohydrate-selective porin OprB
MDTNGKKAEYGGWEVYNKDVSIPAAAVGEKFNFKTTEAIVYIKALMTGAANSRPTTKPPRPSDRTVADWNQAQKDVEDWVDSARDGKKPWYTIPKDFGGRIYHEAYVEYGTWVSYLKAARARGVKGYQFRAPPEWFAELYAAYHMGTLKDSHPMIKLFLRDL